MKKYIVNNDTELASVLGKITRKDAGAFIQIHRQKDDLSKPNEIPTKYPVEVETNVTIKHP